MFRPQRRAAASSGATSVTAGNASLVISPTTGAVVAQLGDPGSGKAWGSDGAGSAAAIPGMVDPFAVACGFVNWSPGGGPSNTQNVFALTAGTVYVNGLWLPFGVPITNVNVWVFTTSSGTAPTSFFAGLASPTAMVAQTADVKTSFASGGVKDLALGASYTPNATDSPTGFYYVVLLQVGSFSVRQPAFAVMSGNNNAGSARGAKPAPWGRTTTAQTALPANGAAIGAVTAGQDQGYFVVACS